MERHGLDAARDACRFADCYTRSLHVAMAGCALSTLLFLGVDRMGGRVHEAGHKGLL